MAFNAEEAGKCRFSNRHSVAKLGDLSVRKGAPANGYGVSGDENGLKLVEMMVVQHYKYIKCHIIVCFKLVKMVNFMSSEFYYQKKNK